MTPTATPLTLVVLISGSGTNLQALIHSIDAGRLAARIVAVISDRPSAGGLDRARRAGIAAEVIDHRDYGDRESFDAVLARCIDGHAPELVLLAGFMRILTERFVARYEGRMLNIHPSLLPDYRGLQTHQRALAAGEPYHGSSVHYVTADLDAGPVVAQARVPVHADDDPERLKARVQQAEHQLYPLVVDWIARGRLAWREGQAWLDDAPLEQPRIFDNEQLGAAF